MILCAATGVVFFLQLSNEERSLQRNCASAGSSIWFLGRLLPNEYKFFAVGRASVADPSFYQLRGQLDVEERRLVA